MRSADQRGPGRLGRGSWKDTGVYGVGVMRQRALRTGLSGRAGVVGRRQPGRESRRTALASDQVLEEALLEEVRSGQ